MERERITISIKKTVLDKVDNTIDGTKIRNRSHAIESLILKGLGKEETRNAVVLLGGDDALKAIPATKEVLKQLKTIGFAHVDIAVGFLGDKVKNKLRNGEEFGLEFKYNDKAEGSGGAILSFKKNLSNTFIVVNQNRFTDINLKSLLNFHQKHNFPATIVTDNLDDFRGIYILDSEVLKMIPKGFSMLEDDLLPKLIKEGKAAVCPVI